MVAIMVGTLARDKRSGSFLRRLILGGVVLVSAVSCMSLLAATLTLERKTAGPVDEQELKELQTLSADELAVLSEQTVQLLSSAPLSNQAVNRLATLRSLLGKHTEAEELAMESATRSHRETRSQLAAVMLFFSKQRYAEGLKHLDGIIRSKPALSKDIFKLLMNYQLDQQFRDKLTELLLSNPPWRWSYFFEATLADKDGQSTFQLLKSLRTAGGTVTADEMRHFLATLINNKNYDLAYFVWLDSLEPASLQKVANIFDQNFDLSPKNSYFDWTLGNYHNARIEIVPDPSKPSEKRLQIDFFGASQRFAHVNQYLRLRSGSYDFEFEYLAKNFESPTGLRWGLYCADGFVYIANSPPTNKNLNWEKLNFSFTIPTERCDTQLLLLESSSDAVLDQKYQGTILFDNLALAQKEPGLVPN